jgi:hypothetical protein
MQEMLETGQRGSQPDHAQSAATAQKEGKVHVPVRPAKSSYEEEIYLASVLEDFVFCHYVDAVGEYRSFFGGPGYNAYRPVRFWKRGGAPVVTLEGIASSGGLNGHRTVIDLRTGQQAKPPQRDEWALQVAFWRMPSGAAVAVKFGVALLLNPGVLDLQKLRARWVQKRGPFDFGFCLVV